MNLYDSIANELQRLREEGNYRSLPTAVLHEGKYIVASGRKMLNLSSNDYLGVGSNIQLQQEFLQGLSNEVYPFTSSSSRLLTGNFPVHEELEMTLADMFGAEAALLFSSGYHANTGILPAICNKHTLILADKLVHASLIDGIRLSAARCVRYRHNDFVQLKRLIEENYTHYGQIIVVTESIFSMDGDTTDLSALIALKYEYDKVLLYVDEAHAFGVRGHKGLGCAEEQHCIRDIDFLVGTFGKAIASAGAYIVCSRLVRDWLINRMRTLIFTTALPPINVAWTLFILNKLPELTAQREHLRVLSTRLQNGLTQKGYQNNSSTHIIPLLTGNSKHAIHIAQELQREGFYALPVRPPTVPEGTARIRFSLTASISMEELNHLIETI